MYPVSEENCREEGFYGVEDKIYPYAIFLFTLFPLISLQVGIQKF